MKKILSAFCLLCICLVTGCTEKQWPVITKTVRIQNAPLNTNYQGEVLQSMSNWNIIADISKDWFNCNYAEILLHTRLSIDPQNGIWVYGPDLDNGPIGGLTDYPDCKGSNSPRVLRFDQESKKTSVVYPMQGDTAELHSASGWSHYDQNTTLLNSVFIYKEPWDGDNGGKGNKVYDIAILDDYGIRSVLSESGSVFSVPNYAISANKIYVIYDSIKEPFPKIVVIDLKTSQIVLSRNLIDCASPKSIAATDENVFLLCQENVHNYSLYVLLADDLTEKVEWKDSIIYTPNLPNNGNGFPLEVDHQGRVWVGYSYVAEKNNQNWELSPLLSIPQMTETYPNGVYPKAIFAMMPYKDGMLFSLEGGLYYSEGENSRWRGIVFDLSVALPTAIGSDGSIYVFTGKYILATSF